MDASIAQQITDARELAACGQPTSALVYFEALIPQLTRCGVLCVCAGCQMPCLHAVWHTHHATSSACAEVALPPPCRRHATPRITTHHRFIGGLQDPYKQTQYNSVLKTLQEEHRLLQDMEAALEEIKSSAPSTSGRSPAVVRLLLGARGNAAVRQKQQVSVHALLLTCLHTLLPAQLNAAG
jgi:hypothetical protein